MNLKEGPTDPTKREFFKRLGRLSLGVVFLPEILAACARPELTSAPIETPKPVEKGVIGDLQLIPISFKESSELKSFFPKQQFPPTTGYKRSLVTLAVKNLGLNPRNASDMNNFNFKIQASGGFTYPEKEMVRGKFMDYHENAGFIIPPGYSLPFFINLDIPTVAKDLKLVANAPTLKSPVVWDLTTEFPPSGQQKEVEYLPKADKNMKQLGVPIEQKHLIFTPQQAKLVWECWNLGKWVLGIKWQVQNRWGYDLNAPINSVVLDLEGNVWNRLLYGSTDNPWGGPGIIPPGVTQERFQVGPMSLHQECNTKKEIPNPPRNLRLLTWVTEQPSIGAPMAWSIYDLEKIAVAPPVFGAYVSGEKLFSSK